MTVALVALVLSMAGNGMAAKSLISGKQIKDGTISGKDIKDGSIKSADLATGAVTSRNLARDSVGAGAIRSASVGSDEIVDNAVYSVDVNDKGGVTGQDVAPGSIGTVQIGDNSITVSDMGAASVDGNALGICGQACTFYASATDALDALANGGLNGGAIADGTVHSEDLVHDDPFTIVSNEDVHMNDTFLSCGIRVQVPFARSENSTGTLWSILQTDRLTAPKSGIYQVTVNGKWAADPSGILHVLSPSKTWGNPPNTGDHKIFDSVTTAPVALGTTDQSLTTEVALDANDYVTLQADSCAASGNPPIDVPLTSIRMSMTWLRNL